jgi:hypothetical protein
MLPWRMGFIAAKALMFNDLDVAIQSNEPRGNPA